MPSKVIKNPSIVPGAIKVVTACISTQCSAIEIDVSNDAKVKSSPKAMRPGRIPFTITVGIASVTMVRDGAYVLMQANVTSSANTKAFTELLITEVLKSGLFEIKLRPNARPA